jgi:ATP-binding cassette subfamily F protein 2
MKKLALATDRSGNGILASDSQSRDIHIQSYSLSFHGRLLIENADFSLNYGQRYVKRLDMRSRVDGRRLTI